MEHKDGWPEHFNITRFDRVIDAGLAVGRLIGRTVAHLSHEGISDHFRHDKPLADVISLTERRASIEQNYDGNGQPVA